MRDGAKRRIGFIMDRAMSGGGIFFDSGIAIELDPVRIVGWLAVAAIVAGFGWMAWRRWRQSRDES